MASEPGTMQQIEFRPCAGRYRVYPRSVWRWTQTCQHWHGIDNVSSHLVPGWTDHWAWRQHRQYRHVGYTQVLRLCWALLICVVTFVTA